jgi:hypothetical protein
LFVRYKQSMPAISAVRLNDQQSLFFDKQSGFLLRLLSQMLKLVFGREDWDILRTLRSGTWPTTKGIVETINVVRTNEREHSFLVPVYVCEIGYSYSVDGEYHSGCWEKTFLREESAKLYGEQRKGMEVIIRYFPRQPSLSVLRPDDQTNSPINSLNKA